MADLFSEFEIDPTAETGGVDLFQEFDIKPETARVSINTPAKNNDTTATSIYLTWSDISGATSYEILKSDTSGFDSYDTLNSLVNNYTFNNLNADTIYYFKVKALNTSTYSLYSAIKSSVTVTYPVVTVRYVLNGSTVSYDGSLNLITGDYLKFIADVSSYEI